MPPPFLGLYLFLAMHRSLHLEPLYLVIFPLQLRDLSSFLGRQCLRNYLGVRLTDGISFPLLQPNSEETSWQRLKLHVPFRTYVEHCDIGHCYSIPAVHITGRDHRLLFFTIYSIVVFFHWSATPLRIVEKSGIDLTIPSNYQHRSKQPVPCFQSFIYHDNVSSQVRQSEGQDKSPDEAAAEWGLLAFAPRGKGRRWTQVFVTSVPSSKHYCSLGELLRVGSPFLVTFVGVE
ncbi:hypothetical protein GGR55DRAFT_355785 [Xylaria sp. FL0064]|nr:hypothetical protein GGR55DRAFT_355785 [Xylaria sp. FL0064]